MDDGNGSLWKECQRNKMQWSEYEEATEGDDHANVGSWKEISLLLRARLLLTSSSLWRLLWLWLFGLCWRGAWRPSEQLPSYLLNTAPT